MRDIQRDEEAARVASLEAPKAHRVGPSGVPWQVPLLIGHVAVLGACACAILIGDHLFIVACQYTTATKGPSNRAMCTLCAWRKLLWDCTESIVNSG